MKCMDRSGNELEQNDLQDRVLVFLYKSKLGRILLKPLIMPWLSKLGSIVLNSSCSKVLIAPFVKACKINLEDYEEREFTSYNDFFTRKIKEGKRIIDDATNHLIAPCDGKLTVYHIDKNSRFKIKNSTYSIKSLLRSKKLAHKYENGTLLLFRLTVDDYHRYCYIDSGKKTKNYRIKGVFHTVNPIANEEFPVYKENTREYTILDSDNFGKVLIMEVGALMVGKIVNYHEEACVKRGEEKGRFEFGGSTVIVCLEKGRALIDKDIMKNSKKGIETVVKMGEKIGRAKCE